MWIGLRNVKGCFLDGDAIEALHNGTAERIWVHGLNCPEKSQPIGYRATKLLKMKI